MTEDHGTERPAEHESTRFRPHRVISVLVETLAIEDGHTPLPVVGNHATFTLGFREANVSTAANLVSTYSVWSEPQTRHPVTERRDFANRPRHDAPRWQTRLVGDGWSATWNADRPTVGQIEVHGTITGDWSYRNSEIARGRVLRVRRVTETSEHTGPGPQDWRAVPSAARLVDIDPAETSIHFDHGLQPGPLVHGGPARQLVPPPELWVYDTGLLVDLDLDDVPAPRLRPPIVAGGVGVHNEDVWITDTRLPLLVHVRGAAVVGETVWSGVILSPEEVAEGRTVSADAGGCWITGPDGVHRADLDGTVRTLAEEPALRTSVTPNGVLFVPKGSAETTARIFQPDGTTRSLTDVPNQVVADGESFVGLTVSPTRALIRIHLDGARQLGPALLEDEAGSLIHGDALWLRHGVTISKVADDLSLGPQVETAPPRRAKSWRIRNGRTWAIGDPPTGTEWDPTVGPRKYLAEIDPHTGTTVSTAVLHVSAVQDFAVDSTGASWIVGAGQLLRCRAGSVEHINVASLLDTYRAAR